MHRPAAALFLHVDADGSAFRPDAIHAHDLEAFGSKKRNQRFDRKVGQVLVINHIEQHLVNHVQSILGFKNKQPIIG